MTKKIITIFLFMLLAFVPLKVHAYDGITDTGHNDIKQLGFLDESQNHKILKTMSDFDINQAMSKVKRKAFGWRLENINYKIPVWYISDVIFSKSNNTHQKIEFKYNLEVSTTKTNDYSMAGSVVGKMNGKLKNLGFNVDATLKGEFGQEIKHYYEETSNFTISIHPGKKISLLVMGDGDLSTGVGKYYFFGMCFKKGTWEYIDYVNEYYEFYEEDI